VYDLGLTQTTPEGEEMELAEPLALTVGTPGSVMPEVTKPGTDLNVVLNALLTLEGIGQPGATIEVLEGTANVASATVEPNGAWQAEVVGLSPGIHLLTVRQATVGGAEAEAMTPQATVIGEGPRWSVAPALVGAGDRQPGETISDRRPARRWCTPGPDCWGEQTDQENWQFRLPSPCPHHGADDNAWRGRALL
jgi:hypothetical protein